MLNSSVVLRRGGEREKTVSNNARARVHDEMMMSAGARVCALEKPAKILSIICCSDLKASRQGYSITHTVTVIVMLINDECSQVEPQLSFALARAAEKNTLKKPSWVGWLVGWVG